jgi:hypothetical protein
LTAIGEESTYDHRPDAGTNSSGHEEHTNAGR